jgi:hypothetical protein
MDVHAIRCELTHLQEYKFITPSHYINHATTLHNRLKACGSAMDEVSLMSFLLDKYKHGTFRQIQIDALNREELTLGYLKRAIAFLPSSKLKNDQDRSREFQRRNHQPVNPGQRHQENFIKKPNGHATRQPTKPCRFCNQNHWDKDCPTNGKSPNTNNRSDRPSRPPVIFTVNNHINK